MAAMVPPEASTPSREKLWLTTFSTHQHHRSRFQVQIRRRLAWPVMLVAIPSHTVHPSLVQNHLLRSSAPLFDPSLFSSMEQTRALMMATSRKMITSRMNFCLHLIPALTTFNILLKLPTHVHDEQAGLPTSCPTFLLSIFRPKTSHRSLQHPQRERPRSFHFLIPVVHL